MHNDLNDAFWAKDVPFAIACEVVLNKLTLPCAAAPGVTLPLSR